MAFNEMLGPSMHLAVEVQELKATVRRNFAWEELLLRLSRTLAALRQSGPDADSRRGLTHAALADTWPAEIVNLPALLAYLAAAGRVPLAVSEQGLLALLVDALADPWDAAVEPLRDPQAYKRSLDARCSPPRCSTSAIRATAPSRSSRRTPCSDSAASVSSISPSARWSAPRSSVRAASATLSGRRRAL